MGTGRKNNKSLQVSVRIPLEDLELIERVREKDESTAGFLVTAARNEINRRQNAVSCVLSEQPSEQEKLQRVNNKESNDAS
ncbi:hypothetical protein FNZ18_20560 [Salmonella enterica subsp. salamae]|nr:hypothetical protein [Salmonella enterica subsp. salamae]